MSAYDTPNKGGRPIGANKHGRVDRDIPQAEIARYRGISRDSQWKLEKLQLLRPDLLEQVKRGESSLAKAMREARLESGRYTLDRDPKKATAAINRHLALEEIDELVLGLVIQQSANYRMSLAEYVSALSTAVLEAVGGPSTAPEKPHTATEVGYIAW